MKNTKTVKEREALFDNLPVGENIVNRIQEALDYYYKNNGYKEKAMQEALRAYRAGKVVLFSRVRSFDKSIKFQIIINNKIVEWMDI